MEQLEKIITQVGARAVKRGSLTLIDRRAAMLVLDVCAKTGVRVLGIEGFLIGFDKVTPVMDAIGDFSSAPSASQSVKDAREFFHVTASSALMFDLELQPNKGDKGGGGS